jgi:hypothetical protein
VAVGPRLPWTVLIDMATHRPLRLHDGPRGRGPGRLAPRAPRGEGPTGVPDAVNNV